MQMQMQVLICKCASGHAKQNKVVQINYPNILFYWLVKLVEILGNIYPNKI